MRKTLLSSLLVGLLTLVGVSQVWAQSVKFTENYYKGYHVASDAETRNFTILTLDKCNWMEIAGYTNINTNLPLSTTEYTQCICRANDYSWACDLMEWFTTTYSVPSYSSASFTTKCLVKVYKAASQYYVIRAAYFDFGEDPSNYWSGRKNDPLGYEYYRTASNCANGGYYWGTDKFYGEKCAVWAYTTHNWSQNVANVDVVSMDNSTGSSDLTTNRYGAFLTSKTISYNWIQNRCHTELYFTYTVDMSYHKIFTFDANGGTGSIAVQNIKNSGNLTTNTPTRTGYTFAGWNTAANGTGTAYTGGQAITATSSDKGAITLYAQWTKIDPVSYLYPEYNTEGDPTSGIKAWKTDSCTDYKVVEDASSQVTWNAGWYVVNGTDVKLTAGAVCNGAVNLILADGAKLTANGANFAASITVSGVNNFLTIYGQANQSGQLIAMGGSYAAGIGGCYETKNGSNITIHGGIVTATGKNGAGIGGGNKGAGSNITINGGTVTATGDYAAGIGGGAMGAGSNITINGGTVTATASNGVTGIGGGMDGSASNIFVNPSLILKAGSSANPTDVIAPTRTATTDIAGDLAGKRYATVTEPQQPVSYIVPVYNTASDPKSGILRWDTLSCTDYTVVEDASSQVTWNAGWYVVNGSKEVAGIVCSGAVHLILADGATLYAQCMDSGAGIQVTEGSSLTIYGQANQTGQLLAQGNRNAAGIGGGENGAGANITINGGIVTAIGDGAAGIGGGNGGEGKYITINGGKVTADGANQAAGIGGGHEGAGSYITINGGTVNANGHNAAGIGGGGKGDGSNITINGGTVTATGGYQGAGIGGGSHQGTGSYITIKGGIVTATGGENAAGIGGGYAGSGSEITISNGTITATGGKGGAGIGGGYYGESEHITIIGGTVTATGSDGGAGIGGGQGVRGLEITISGGEVTATGGENAAGIGGGQEGDGSIITIHDGTVTATGGSNGAGIGGGYYGEGSEITINGGTVKATGGEGADGIGCGAESEEAASDIFVDPSLLLKADGNNPPTTVIAPTRTATTDVAGDLAGKQYATTEPKPDPVSYIAPVYNTASDPKSGILRWDTLSCTDYTVVEDASSQVTWNAGWYVVNGTDVKLTAGAVCNGAVNLILADGAKLTANGANFAASITVSGVNNFLTIYGQANQSGQLIATGGKNGSAIGGGQTAPGSNITINGGVVNAMGGLKGAGIGSGASDGTTGLAGSNITINGGTVTATGGGNAAGIGGGGGNYAAGSYITINGGTVTATGGSAAAGIGGGYAGAGSNITINGGEVTATGDDGAGIGGGCYGAGSYITIHGGTVTAKGGNNAAGIGSGEMGSSASNIFVNPSLILKAGASANPTDVIASTRTATTDIAEDLAGKQYATVTEPQQPVSYIVPVYNTASDPKSGILRWDTLSCTDYKVMDGGYDTWETGWYVVTSDITFEEGIICNGAVHLILADDAKLTINAENGAGITVSGDANSLTIYGQANQSGQLIATGGYESASIGGIEEGDGSNITINGGKVTATAYGNGAAIGGGKEGSGSYITINGGTVTATSEGAAAGIGGGDGGIGSNITINGGTVTATGGYNAAGIGGGFMGNGSYITIYGGTVTATGGNSAAGIGGGGNGGEGSYITIHGGTVTATGGSYGAGIGGGKGGEGKYITINDGEVNATGGENAAGIGGGDGGIGLNITIHGGTVTATGGNGAAGIGGGPGEIGTDITINGGTVTATGGENAAGIGGGRESRGLYITIKSGIVTATGGEGAAGIGSGVDGDAASNIFVDPSLILKAGASANPTDVIASTRTATTDIAGDLAGKQYATVTEPEPIYTRKVTNGNFGTICLAKAFSDVKGIEGLYKPATQATDFSVLYCTEVLLSEVKAGESYIFQADSDVVVFTLEGEAVTAAVVANNMLGNLGDTVIVDESFIATYSDYSILGTPAGASEQQMVKLVVGSKLMPNRAMINLKTVPATGAPQPTPGRRIATIGRNVPTGLVDVNANLNETRKVMINGQLIIIRDSKMFNAQGQKL